MATFVLKPEPIAVPPPKTEKPARSDDASHIWRRVLWRLLLFPPVVAVFLFVPAGTIAYWQAWVYLAVVILPMIAEVLHLVRRDPAFLARRMRTREKEQRQRRMVLPGILAYVGLFVVPALDYRFGWSSPPVWAVLCADAVVLAGYALIVWVFETNRFAGRTVEVEAGQEVVTGGPYRWVRHPMYVGVLAMMMLTPLALGSLWGLLAGLPLPVVLVIRILDEERALRRDLPGYDEYTRRTRYRLIPKVW